MSTLEKFKRSLKEPARKPVKDTDAASGNTLEPSPFGAFGVPSFSHKWSQQLGSVLQMREKGTKGNYSPPCNQQENAVASEIVITYTVMC